MDLCQLNEEEIRRHGDRFFPHLLPHYRALAIKAALSDIQWRQATHTEVFSIRFIKAPGGEFKRVPGSVTTTHPNWP